MVGNFRKHLRKQEFLAIKLKESQQEFPIMQSKKNKCVKGLNVFRYFLFELC